LSEPQIPLETRRAIERLLNVAMNPTGQSSIVTNFLLAWWNADECGGFDLTEIWAVDQDIAADMVAVFATIARSHHYPDTLGYGARFDQLVRSAYRGDVKNPMLRPPRG
jgi:hypothetical protein